MAVAIMIGEEYNLGLLNTEAVFIGGVLFLW